MEEMQHFGFEYQVVKQVYMLHFKRLYFMVNFNYRL